jgi:DNA-binding XRE family transcriptional regulator
MNSRKISLLKKKGWSIGDAGDFLSLSPDERAYIEMKASLARCFAEIRTKKHLTQQQLAHLLKSSQSRVAKMERNDSSVSLDLLVRSLLIMGATRKTVGEIIRQ